MASDNVNEDKLVSFVVKQLGSSFNLKMHLDHGGGAAFEAITLLWSQSVGEASAQWGWAPGRRREGWHHSWFRLGGQLVYIVFTD